MVDVAHAASTAPSTQPIGGWSGPAEPVFSGQALTETAHRLRDRIHVVTDQHGRLGVASGGSIGPAGSGWPVHAVLAEMYPEWLGDRSFGEAHGTRFPYVTGAMANGIATTELVVEIARTGGLGFFGAAGLERRIVERAIDEMEAALGGTGRPWGCNLIHSPQEPSLEASVADLYIRRNVRRVSAAAFMSLTPSIVRYAYSGIRTGSDGRVERPNMVFAKISRPETARAFMNPAPTPMLDALVARSLLTAQEAAIAATLPVAEDITIESDSGGHTDNRPLGPLFSAIQVERDAAIRRHGYSRPIRLGAAGGIGTPQAVASAFALGAAYVLTGTVNEACVESGLSDEGREMLAMADLADVTMAPAADMFELGVDLQVLQRGTMFASRAKKLYALYSTHRSLDDISDDQRRDLETKILGQTVDECWAETKVFWMHRDPEQVERAERDPRHRMALVFRSYLGRSSRWSMEGVSERRLDYQIWCGPAMGAFNAWTAGTFLAEPANRRVAQVARNLLEGAAAITRAHQLRTYGVAMPASAFAYEPRPLAVELDR